MPEDETKTEETPAAAPETAAPAATPAAPEEETCTIRMVKRGKLSDKNPQGLPEGVKEAPVVRIAQGEFDQTFVRKDQPKTGWKVPTWMRRTFNDHPDFEVVA